MSNLTKYMNMRGHLKSAKSLFRWRTTEVVDGNIKDTRWRRHDKLVAFVAFIITLTSMFRGPVDCYDTWTTLKETLWETVSFLAVVITGVKVIKGLKPEYFHYKLEPLAELFEQRDHDISIEEHTGKRTTIDSSTQTDGRNYIIEGKRLERTHQREMRRLQRHTVRLKRSLQEQLNKTKVLENEKGKELSDEYLKLLPLVSRKESLLQEKENLEMHTREEESRHQDLTERLKRAEGHIQTEEELTSQEKDRSKSLLESVAYLGGGDCLQPSIKTIDQDIDNITKDKPITNTSTTDMCIPYSILTNSFGPNHNNRKVRMLYSIEQGDDGGVKYLEISPTVYSVYETGSCLLPAQAIEQMLIKAVPLSDGTLHLEEVTRYKGGIPRQVLLQGDQYMTMEEFRRATGLQTTESLKPVDVIFRTGCNFK